MRQKSTLLARHVGGLDRLLDRGATPALMTGNGTAASEPRARAAVGRP